MVKSLEKIFVTRICGRLFRRSVSVSFPKKPETIWNGATVVSPLPTAADHVFTVTEFLPKVKWCYQLKEKISCWWSFNVGMLSSVTKLASIAAATLLLLALLCSLHLALASSSRPSSMVFLRAAWSGHFNPYTSLLFGLKGSWLAPESTEISLSDNAVSQKCAR